MTLTRRAVPLAVALLAWGPSLRAQISPGPLAKAHATLEGSTRCVECHGLRKEPMAQRCLSCHKEVAWLMARGRGLHAPSRNVPARTCASCHPDHAGADFDLIDWGKGGSAAFDHARSGWPLDGKHARAKCAACHTTEFRTAPAAALSPRTHGAGWTGLETACIACHARDDVHRKSLGASCERCHDAEDWRKPTRFDHAKSSYPLTGKHADVACDKCHKARGLKLTTASDGRVIGLYKPLPAAECSACHADPHKGRLKAECSDCHSTRGFHDVKRKGFDHAATRYPLLGKHAAVTCEACHGVGLTRKTPSFTKCADCHTDAHGGRATLAGEIVDCAACHRVEGFAPATYTVAQHQLTAYPLNGKHALVACSRCHVATDSVVRAASRTVLRRVDLRPSATSCVACHEDTHRGELAGTESRGQCTACHDERAWSPSTYTIARHATLRFALDGAHRTVACGRCHAGVGRGAATTPSGATLHAAGTAPEARRTAAHVPLRVRTACDACHLDPHAGRYSEGAAKAPSAGCGACHDARRWAPATMAASLHTALGFALDGAHRAVPCRECHRELGAAPSRVTLRQPGARVASLPFNTTPRSACAVCHTDPHAGQFAVRPESGACERCHDASRWSGAARFVHDRDTSFPLAGAHSRVPCAACHKPVAQSGGGTRVLYRPLPTACEGCHADGVPRIRP